MSNLPTTSTSEAEAAKAAEQRELAIAKQFSDRIGDEIDPKYLEDDSDDATDEAPEAEEAEEKETPEGQSDARNDADPEGEPAAGPEPDRAAMERRLSLEIDAETLGGLPDDRIAKLYANAKKRDAGVQKIKTERTALKDENSQLRTRIEALEAAVGERTNPEERGIQAARTEGDELDDGGSEFLAKLGLEDDPDAQKALDGMLNRREAGLRAEIAELRAGLETVASTEHQRRTESVEQQIGDIRASLADRWAVVGESDRAFQALIDDVTRAKKAGAEGDLASLFEDAARGIYGEGEPREETREEAPAEAPSKPTRGSQPSRPKRRGAKQRTPEQREYAAALAALDGRGVEGIAREYNR